MFKSSSQSVEIYLNLSIVELNDGVKDFIKIETGIGS